MFNGASVQSYLCGENTMAALTGVQGPETGKYEMYRMHSNSSSGVTENTLHIHIDVMPPNWLQNVAYTHPSS